MAIFQLIDLVVYEFGTTNPLNFNFKIYQRDNARSYRPGERQTLPGDLHVWPNQTPVDTGHLIWETGVEVASPFTVMLPEDDSYYIVVWKDGYDTDKRWIYVPLPFFYDEDGNPIGNYPADIVFELRPIELSNARIFV